MLVSSTPPPLARLNQSRRLWLCFLASLLGHALLLVPGGYSIGHQAAPGITAPPPRLLATLNASAPLPFERQIPFDQPETSSVPESEPSLADNQLPVANSGLPAALDSNRYYVRSELTEPPRLLGTIHVGTPPSRREVRWVARIRIYLAASGAVDRISIEESTAPGHIEEELLASLRSNLYAPGQVGRTAVKSQLVIEVQEE